MHLDDTSTSYKIGLSLHHTKCGSLGLKIALQRVVLTPPLPPPPIVSLGAHEPPRREVQEGGERAVIPYAVGFFFTRVNTAQVVPCASFVIELRCRHRPLSATNKNRQINEADQKAEQVQPEFLQGVWVDGDKSPSQNIFVYGGLTPPPTPVNVETPSLAKKFSVYKSASKLKKDEGIFFFVSHSQITSWEMCMTWDHWKY